MWDFGFKVQDCVDTQHFVVKQENYKLNIIQQIERELIYNTHNNLIMMKTTLIMCLVNYFFFQIVYTEGLKNHRQIIMHA